MKNIKKTITFSVIALISIMLIACNRMGNLKENVYVVSESDTNKKQSVLQKDEEDISKEKNNSDNKVKYKEITVYISGEVNKPGVVTLDSQKRLSDAVDSLGGVTKDADLNRINLASRLEDEKHYIIPKIGEEIFDESVSKKEGSSDNLIQESSKVNINTASQKELDELPGVGEVTADKIIKYREETGKFKSVEEIKNVNGIGDKKYEELKEVISID